ncbi:hypothetical protein F4777DRAFT_477916 [Nemania sp. FL0916]|nr:hypothetical protein F4777DRAFT_477916 [Nemania sp. FL0916]
MSVYTADARAITGSVLRCGQCNKPFDKQSTFKRHFYYCRSRNINNTSRHRSCIPCARSKTACDRNRPQCSKCMAKSRDCQYPSNAARSAKGGATRVDEVVAAASSPAAEPLAVDGIYEASSGGSIDLSGALDVGVIDFAGISDGCIMGWEDTEAAFMNIFNPQSHELSPIDSSLLSSHSTPSIQPLAQDQRSLFSPQASIPATPTSAIRALVQRPRMQPGAQRITNLILHTLKSYPLMILRHDTIPPFIHPSTVSPEVEDPHMELLMNCISLTRMISGGARGSRKLFWKNVQLECERLLHEKSHKWELLAAMQALSIYILIRLDEGETNYNNSDALLVRAVIVTAKQLGELDVTCHNHCGLCNVHLRPSWKEWIFRESRRRLAIIYRVVNMLVYFEPAAMCSMPTEFILAPLPARKQLWEAAGEFSWKTESQKPPGIQLSFGLCADGEIAALDESRLSCADTWLVYRSTDDDAKAKTPPRSAVGWEEWCTGIDGFGGLVMLAASLIA